MQFSIDFGHKVNPFLYRQFSLFIFNRVKRSVELLADKRKYRAREDYIINCSLIKWKKVPKRLDIYYFITNCLELVKLEGVYVIRVNETKLIPNSFTKVKTLVRVLEYGTNLIRGYPVILRVMRYYKENYKSMFSEFLKERFTS